METEKRVPWWQRAKAYAAIYGFGALISLLALQVAWLIAPAKTEMGAVLGTITAIVLGTGMGVSSLQKVWRADGLAHEPFLIALKYTLFLFVFGMAFTGIPVYFASHFDSRFQAGQPGSAFAVIIGFGTVITLFLGTRWRQQIPEWALDAIDWEIDHTKKSATRRWRIKEG